jgi:hypothetical protein
VESFVAATRDPAIPEAQRRIPEGGAAQLSFPQRESWKAYRTGGSRLADALHVDIRERE